MNVAVLSSRGQITIPIDIRRRLGLCGGEKFYVDEQGKDVIIRNNVHPNVVALRNIQKAMAGEAERVGWKSEEDVVNYCKEIRREMWEKRALR
jgi:AbrB family looped-hinge helix DNA binding protein